jgi:TRAP-type mannitol/chloroaromatic compound transport system substrate-binding protein
MKRRDFIKGATAGGIVAGSTLLGACNKSDNKSSSAQSSSSKTYNWKMVTTWPKGFPGLGTGADNLAALITEMSGGRINVKVYGAKELVPAFEVFDSVSKGTAEMGHGGAYYWKGKIEAAQFFSTVPFGLNAQEMNGWLYYGGGLKLWQELYAPFNLVPFAAGNTGTQMGGWFNKEIKSVNDLSGLKMRMPGLGGEVLKRIGGTPVTLPGGEIYTSLQSGAIDATEWVGPYNDLAFGFYKIAKFYYYPGWHEPGTTLEAIVNKTALEALPADLQSIVRNACKAVNLDMLAEYTARNNDALDKLVNLHKVKLLAYPNDVLNELRNISDEVIQDVANKSAVNKKVYDSFIQYRDQVTQWHKVSEQAYLNARNS